MNYKEVALPRRVAREGRWISFFRIQYCHEPFSKRETSEADTSRCTLRFSGQLLNFRAGNYTRGIRMNRSCSLGSSREIKKIGRRGKSWPPNFWEIELGKRENKIKSETESEERKRERESVKNRWKKIKLARGERNFCGERIVSTPRN